MLIDFGSARGEIAAQSRTVSALVKPGYSPYEQYATTSSNQGPWTDIYAMGATLYHAVTGKRPPDAPSRVVGDEYVPARQAALGAYRIGFLHAIDKALKIETSERPQSIAACARPEARTGARRAASAHRAQAWPVARRGYRRLERGTRGTPGRRRRSYRHASRYTADPGAGAT